MQSDKKKVVLQAIKFALFSASAGIIQVLVDVFFNEVAQLPAQYSYLIALVCSVLYNFTVNRKFTFKATNNVPVAMLKVALFYCAFTPLSTWTTKILTTHGVHKYIVLAGTMICNLVLEFLYCKFFVYREKKKSEVTNTTDAPTDETKSETIRPTANAQDDIAEQINVNEQREDCDRQIDD
ncbi:MAG: GtrA family protein [Christensenellales bacterium]